MSRKILIVDDEKGARERLERIIHEIDSNCIIVQASDGLEALEKIEASDFDFVFLDVEMPELTGIDVAHSLPKRDFQLVFQTAFEQYAVEAFSLSVTDYLLKPYTRERVKQCWDRLTERSNERDGKAEELKESLAKGKCFLENIVVRMPGRMKIVNVEDISHFSASQRGVLLWSEGNSLSCDQTLAELESSLNPEDFLRIHKSTLINMHYLQKVGTVRPIMATLSDGSELRVSREREKHLHERLRQFSKKG